ncbi:hypothetical protein DFH09DRAFT_1398327 [Mycena vulgaris]|nr:hypothetical protein DFH09DRAFT_1398327 [Mycena vulgaris]
MSTAKNMVICTPELLELVLSHLPMRDLLITAPLVSKTWQVITLSPALQRALFFQPDPSAEPVQNPLLMEMFPPFFAPEGDSRWSWPGNVSSIKSMPWSKAPGAFKRKEASWRRMLVMQPPAQNMTVTEICHGRGGDFERRAVLDDLSLRMGILYALAVPFIDRVASSFCIRWHDNSDAEGDLTLAVIFTQQCRMGREGLLDKRFSSDEAKSTEINFGEWAQRQRYYY